MAAYRRLPQRLSRLLSGSIGSIERLDVLLFLRTHRHKSFSARGVIEALQVSPIRCENHLAALCAFGFLTVMLGSDLVYRYEPAGPQIDAMLEEIDDLNRTRRADVVTALEHRSEPHHPVTGPWLGGSRGHEGHGDGKM